ncbi:C-type lectin domain family 2 member D-like [Mauremys reevesii]|uniref:C-type lectin domain family 2 member D-like n=1 Tax=Mauremys reevesii TaxID=260615 RepID=UPI00193F98D9|nr:C-type lectin domain family 2 member D-like [Mauremys reevesii]
MEKVAVSAQSDQLLAPNGKGEPERREAEPGYWPGPQSSKPAAQKVLVAVLGAVIALLVLTLIVTTAVLAGGKSTPCLAAVACPDGWLRYGGKCYYFSELEGNWSSSQSHCSSLSASLAGIDTLQEKAFMLRYKGLPDHWIGLRREQDQPWKWPNGTEFNNPFEVTVEGDCAYLNEKGVVSSSRCYTRRNWICSKPDVMMKTNDNSAGRD